MGTSIVSPSAANSSFDSINNAFNNIYSMFNPSSTSNNSTNLFGTAASGGGTGSSGISPLTNPDNSLTGLWYNLANLAGPESQQLYGAGTSLINQGNTVFNQGTTDISAPTAYYQQLLSGNPATVTAALAPTAANISAIMSGATNQASQGLPQGGYRAATMANLPFAQAAQVGNAALGLQPAAAQQLANLGISQQQAGVSQEQAGSTLTGQGMQSLQNLISDTINKMNINYQNSGINQFAKLAGGISTLLGSGAGLTGAIGGLNFGGSPSSSSGLSTSNPNPTSFPLATYGY